MLLLTIHGSTHPHTFIHFHNLIHFTATHVNLNNHFSFFFWFSTLFVVRWTCTILRISNKHWSCEAYNCTHTLSTHKWTQVHINHQQALNRPVAEFSTWTIDINPNYFFLLLSLHKWITTTFKSTSTWTHNLQWKNLKHSFPTSKTSLSTRTFLLIIFLLHFNFND